MRWRGAGSLALGVVLATGTAGAQSKTFTTSADFEAGVLASVVHTSPAHQLVLGPVPVLQQHRVHTTNYPYGYVVRVDTITGAQTGRFDSSLTLVNGVATGAPPANQHCDFSSTGNCPHFVAVGPEGDVWVLNSAHGQQGTLTRIAGDLARCVDRDQSGAIDTSLDLSGDGMISVVAGSGEYLGQSDECVLATVKVGAPAMMPRGVAIDRRGRPWAATHQDGVLYRFSATDPLALEVTHVVGGTPFGLATGGAHLFVARSSGNTVQRVHTDTLVTQSVACPGLAGAHAVVAEPGGDVAWLAGFFTGNGVWRANFANGTCLYVDTGTQTTAITLDLAGNAWATGYFAATVHKLGPSGLLLGTYPGGGTSPLGISVDALGSVWVVNAGPTPALAKLHAGTGALVGTYPLGGPGVVDATPFSLGDLTGMQVARSAPYVKSGTWRGTFDGGVDGVPWTAVTWNTEPQGATPAETTLEVSARAADTQAALAQQAFVGAVNGGALSGVSGRFVEVQVALTGPGFATAALSDVTVSGPCGAPGEACCLADAHCDDGDPCTVDACDAPGQACVHAPVLGCCVDDAACSDADACTADACDVATSLCVSSPVPGCCNTALDCDDGAPCTLDVCPGPGGPCEHSPISQCCVSDADCDDGAACTADACGAGNLCVHLGVPGCCASDADCQEAPDDLCTANECDLATGTCASTGLGPLGCCNTSADCDDGDACTADACSGPGGHCSHVESTDCCTVDDPEVGEPCEAPTPPFDAPPCQAGAWACVSGALVCEGAVGPTTDVCDGVDNDCNGFVDLPGTCPSGQSCVEGACVDVPSAGGGGQGGAGQGGDPSGGGGADGAPVAPSGCACGVSDLGARDEALWGLCLAALALARRRRERRAA